MGKPLRVLMVEDSEDDVLLTIRELKKGGYEPEYERVETAEAMRKALRNKPWDVILCDYQMPQFNGLTAIALLKETIVDIPLIIVSGAIVEKMAVECMRLGARDYVMKGNLSRLASAIERELKAAESRRERKQVEEDLRTSEERFRTIFDQGPLGIALIDSMTGHIRTANPMFAKIADRSMEEMTHVDWMSLTHPDDVREILDNIALLNAGGITIFQTTMRFLHSDDTIVWISMTITPLKVEDKLYPLHLCMIEDITERKQVEEALRESEELFRSYLEYAPDGVYMSDLEGNFLYGNRKCEEITGYRREELVGKNFLELNILPEKNMNKAAQLLQVNIEGKSTGPDEMEVISKEGRLIPLEINTNVVRRMGSRIVLAFVRDITERKRAEDKIRKSEERLRDIIFSVADWVWEVDENGIYTYTSQKGIDLFGESRGDIIGKTPFDFMPPDEAKRVAAIFSEIAAKKAPIKDLENWNIRRNGQRVCLLTNGVPILDEEGNLKGYRGVDKDITESKQAEKQLQDTLESLRKAVGVTIQVMVSAVETRDPYTAGHQIRSADLARAIAAEMRLPQDKIDSIRMAGSIHDIGKLSIPAEILSKPTELSKIEFALIKEHACQGHKILKNVESSWPLAEMVYQHHERMDGSGYPRRLKGDDILMEARILAVADVVEAMASHRPYRPALGLSAALEEIEKNIGTLYDADAADACLRLFREKGFRLERT